MILQYNLETEQEGKIEIKDMSGTTRLVLPFIGLQNQVTLITRDWNSGMYIATLKIDGKSTESVKFTLVK